MERVRTPAMNTNRVYPLLIAAAGLLGCCRDKPSIRVIESVQSPDKRITAVVFEESGGGAAGYMHHNVCIHKTGDVANYDDAVVTLGRMRGVFVIWTGNRALEVHCAVKTDDVRVQASILGVSVTLK